MKTLLFSLVAALTVKEGGHALTKVVKLLEDMQTTSRSDGEQDQKDFEDFVCTADKQLQEANDEIKKSTEIITRLSGRVEQLIGRNGRLEQEIEDLTKDLQKNEDEQNSLTTQREAENEAFKEKKADLEGMIEQLKEAVKILADIGADQTSEDRDTSDRDRFTKHGTLTAIRSRLRHTMRGVEEFLQGKQKAKVTAFIEAPFTGTYTSQSGEIIGILKNMQDQGEADHTNAIATEKRQLEAFDKMMALLQEDAETMEESRANRQSELAENKAELTAAKKTIETNKENKATNEKIVADVTADKAEKTRKHEGRRATRAKEEAAISQAIAILNADTSFDNKAFDTAFLQLRNTHQMAIRKHEERPWHESPFAAVLVEIEKMLKVLDEEQQVDENKKSWCEDENKKNDENLTASQDAKAAEDANIARETRDLEENRASLAERQEEIKRLAEEKKEITETRTLENRTYQTTVADLKSAQDVLARALQTLSSFYEAEETANSETDHEYKKQGGGEVIALLQDIETQMKDSEARAHADEEEDVKMFNQNIEDNMLTTENLKKASMELRSSIADGEERLQNAQNEFARQSEIEAKIQEYQKSIKPGCDFILDNFTQRSQNRDTERKQLEFGRDKVQELEGAGKVFREQEK